MLTQLHWMVLWPPKPAGIVVQATCPVDQEDPIRQFRVQRSYHSFIKKLWYASLIGNVNLAHNIAVKVRTVNYRSHLQLILPGS